MSPPDLNPFGSKLRTFQSVAEIALLTPRCCAWPVSVQSSWLWGQGRPVRSCKRHGWTKSSVRCRDYRNLGIETGRMAVDLMTSPHSLTITCFRLSSVLTASALGNLAKVSPPVIETVNTRSTSRKTPSLWDDGMLHGMRSDLLSQWSSSLLAFAGCRYPSGHSRAWMPPRDHQIIASQVPARYQRGCMATIISLYLVTSQKPSCSSQSVLTRTSSRWD